MTNRDALLIANLREAARIVGAGGDVGSDFFARAADLAMGIERVAALLERSHECPLAYLRALLARRRAKCTWCAPTFDLDDHLAGADGAADLGNAIYESL